MKKILILIITLLVLSGCSASVRVKDSSNENYLNLIDTLKNRTIFSESSNNFSITTDIAKTSDAYRFYVIIDNPKNALYGIEAVAIEKDIDYSNVMAANVGVFESTSYNMIPGQANVEKGYVSGLSISGLTNNSDPEIYVLVQWYSSKQEIHQEFFKLNASFGG